MSKNWKVKLPMWDTFLTGLQRYVPRQFLSIHLFESFNLPFGGQIINLYHRCIYLAIFVVKKPNPFWITWFLCIVPSFLHLKRSAWPNNSDQIGPKFFMRGFPIWGNTLNHLRWNPILRLFLLSYPARAFPYNLWSELFNLHLGPMHRRRYLTTLLFWFADSFIWKIANIRSYQKP